MLLHEFLSHHRDELITEVGDKLLKKYPGRARTELVDGLCEFVDDVVGALKVHAQPQGSQGEEHERLAVAALIGAHLGAERQRAGFEITTVPETIGFISSTFGEIGEREGQTFSAGEYKVFNESIDIAVSRGIERYWQESQEREQKTQTRRLGSFAHELRNALSSARMAFGALRGGSVSMSGRTGDLLARSLARMDALVTHVLGMVTLDAAMSPRLEPINLPMFVRQLIEATVPERGIQIFQEPPEESFNAMGDQRLVTSALSNLLQNAVKFTKDGGRVRVRTRAEPGAILVDVEDECGGLPPGKTEELFAPFSQHGRDRRGIGLGLSITREAMQAQGGDVSVRNIPGKGCVFTLHFAQSSSREARSPEEVK